MLESESRQDSIPPTEIIDSLHSFLAYRTLGALISDGVLKGRLPNSVVLMKALDTNISQLNDALQRLRSEGLISVRDSRLMGESAGQIEPGARAFNHLIPSRESTSA